MAQTDWPIFIAFLMSLTLLVVGLACLLCTEEIQRYALRFNPFSKRMTAPQDGRHLRVLGWLAISTGIPLTIIFAKKWFETWFV